CRRGGHLVGSSLAPYAVATVHPSSILRAPDSESRHQQMRAFINDLSQVARLANKKQAARAPGGPSKGIAPRADYSKPSKRLQNPFDSAPITGRSTLATGGSYAGKGNHTARPGT